MPAPSPSSLVDVVDESDVPIGVITRAQVRRSAGFRTVHVLVRNGAGDLLLQQLAPTRERHPLLWGSSAAGHLHAGEAYETAAARCLREEVDVHAEPLLLGVTPMLDEGVRKFIGVFSAQSDEARLAAPDQVVALRFWPVTELEQAVHSEPDRFTASLRHVLGFVRDLDAAPADIRDPG